MCRRIISSRASRTLEQLAQTPTGDQALQRIEHA